MATKPPIFKRTKAVTLPALSMSDNETRYLRFDATIYKGKTVKSDMEKPADVVDTSGRAKKEPPYLAEITDMNTGEKMTLIVNKVLKLTLEDKYPPEKDGGTPTYIGRIFEVQKLPKKKGKEYNVFTVYEVDMVAPEKDAKG